MSKCGPHCGVNNNERAHCKGCHKKITHGNAIFDVTEPKGFNWRAGPVTKTVSSTTVVSPERNNGRP